MNEDKQIVLNQIRTPDGTILVSRNTHDYKTYTDKVSGEEYMVDGGCDYLRRNVNKVPYEELTVYLDSPYEIIREHCYWGSRGIDGNQPIEYLKLKDMESKHIVAILETQRLLEWRKTIFEKELEYRRLIEVGIEPESSESFINL